MVSIASWHCVIELDRRVFGWVWRTRRASGSETPSATCMLLKEWWPGTEYGLDLLGHLARRSPSTAPKQRIESSTYPILQPRFFGEMLPVAGIRAESWNRSRISARCVGESALEASLGTRPARLADLDPRSDDIRRMIRASGGIIDALGTLRNHASLAHPNEEVTKPCSSST
jgi:hypothetical protein